ncbi:MAG: hypothetical protein ACLT98_00975 [Eggerthellaceae bacterium]
MTIATWALSVVRATLRDGVDNGTVYAVIPDAAEKPLVWIWDRASGVRLQFLD